MREKTPEEFRKKLGVPFCGLAAWCFALTIHYHRSSPRLPVMKSHSLAHPNHINARGLEKNDLAVLNQTAPGLPELASSWMRLATQRNALARQKALHLLSESDGTMRKPVDAKLQATAIRVLGYFDEAETNQKLSRLLGSPIPTVRKTALQALVSGAQAGSPRESILREDLHRARAMNPTRYLEFPDTVTELASLFRISRDAKIRADSLRQLRSIASARSPSVSRKAASEILRGIDVSIR